MTGKTYLCLNHCYLGVLLLVAKLNSYLVRLEAGVCFCVLEGITQNKRMGGLEFFIALKSLVNIKR